MALLIIQNSHYQTAIRILLLLLYSLDCIVLSSGNHYDNHNEYNSSHITYTIIAEIISYY